MTSLIGLIHFAASVGYFAISIAQITKVDKRKSFELPCRILQLIFIPIFLLISGIILLFQGWRLDPILQLQQLLMLILTSYLLFLDWTRSFSSRSRGVS